LALSQHLKTLTLVIGASVALSGCGAQQPGAAAIVNDTTVRHQDIVIRDADAQSVPLELNALAQGGQELKVSDALLSLILAPYVLDEAKRVGKTVSASEARKVIAKVANPSPSAVAFVQTQLAIQKLDQASKTRIVDELGKVKITVNPRYGAFDATQVALTPIEPNWIKASAPSPAK
jgi:parvulin-like peptidyl-prolyl isomerase